MQRLPTGVQKQFSGTRAVWLNFAALAKGTGSLHPGRDTLRAVHLDWLELIDPNTKIFKPAPELRALLESKRLRLEREVNTYCGGGRRGSIGTLVLKLLGYDNARSYVAGFSQWSRQPDTTVES